MLPLTHRPEAAGTVAPVSAVTSSRQALETFENTAGRGGAAVRPRKPPASGDDTDTDACATTTRCPQMDFVGARGRIPNLYWHAPDESQLRRHPRFMGLPPEDTIILGSEASFRFIRQGTALWDDLHAGRLTTGCLTGALGFQEDGVHRSLGMGGRGGSHGPLLGAYYRLLQKPLAFDLKGLDREEESKANERIVRIYNDAQNALGPFVPKDETEMAKVPPPRTTKNGSVTKKNRNSKRKKQNANSFSSSVHETTTKCRVSELGPPVAWLARRDPHSRAAAQRGDGGVRMAWGSAQEHGTVATLMLHHPDSVAEEVGLCVVDHASVPREWGVGPLPPMGASPDGIITMDTSSWFSRGEGEPDAEERRERLVVEVKNSSPFRKSRDSKAFEVTDRDPFESPPAYHMPQLQMEMLAAGTTGGLLCMQSATRGVRVFYVARDDGYVAAMLGILSDLFTRHVLTRTPPPERAFNARKDHQALVRATRRLAQKCVLVEEMPHHQLPGEAYDVRPFVA